MRFKVRGQDAPEKVVEFWLEMHLNSVALWAHDGREKRRLAMIDPGGSLRRDDNLPPDLGIPLTPEGRIQIAGQEKTVKEQYAEETFSGLVDLLDAVESHDPERVAEYVTRTYALLAKIREEDDER